LIVIIKDIFYISLPRSFEKEFIIMAAKTRKKEKEKYCPIHDEHFLIP
jgi:hypothetical protein